MSGRGAGRSARVVLATLYVAVTLSPLAVLTAVRLPQARPFAVEFSVALGFAGFALTCMQFVLPARARPVTRTVGADALVRLHRQVGVVAGVLVLAHVAVLVVHDPASFALLDPVHAPARARWGLLSVAAFTTLVATSMWRRRLNLRYEGWRAAHLLLGAAALCFALLHVLGVGHYLQAASVRAHTAAVVALGVAALVYVRLVRPRRTGRRPYVIRDVRRERGGATTLELEAAGHGGHRFRPGQFAWLRLASRPPALAENPFSFASSAAEPARPQFTIKAVGDFTNRVAGLRPGTPVLLDGPHGSWRPALAAGGYVLIVAGIGVTPAMSVLRTLADAADGRRLVLIYGNRRWQDVTYREELDLLQRRLALRVVHVLSEPHEGWDGERGRIDAGLLERVWPDGGPYNVLVCGPPAMVEATCRALRRRGVPRRLVRAETFAG